MQHALQETGTNGTLVDIHRCRIHHCTGCMVCRKTGDCRLERDDAHRLAEMIREADLLIVGSPTY